MRYFVVSLGIVLLAAGLFVSPSQADPISYTVTGAFGPSTGSAPLAGPDGSFSISFSIAQNPTPDSFDTSAGDFGFFGVPITYSFQCSTCSTPTILNTTEDDIFFAAATAGMFVLEFLDDGHFYFFDLRGDQLFTGSVEHPTMLSITGDLQARGRFQLDDNDFVDLGTPQVTVSTPEPSTLAFMLAALASLGLIAFVKTQRA
jgi:PEP-CTERM motif